MEEINKVLTEAMGECWHEFVPQDDRCNHCNNTYKFKHDIWYDFLTWKGFGELWTWAIKQTWWTDFVFYQNAYTDDTAMSWISSQEIKEFVDPEGFAKAVAQYLQKK